MEKYSVEFKNVNKKMGGVNRIDNLTLNLSKGKIYAIIGPNGSGKTTLMNLITGLYRPDEGKISVFEYNPISDYKEVRRLIGYVPQETSLYPEFSARDNLRLYAALYLSDLNDIEGKINELLKLVELTERADEPVKTYSGGMKRRLSIGRALLTDPKILLLDEPPHACTRPPRSCRATRGRRRSCRAGARRRRGSPRQRSSTSPTRG